MGISFVWNINKTILDFVYPWNCFEKFHIIHIILKYRAFTIFLVFWSEEYRVNFKTFQQISECKSFTQTFSRIG